MHFQGISLASFLAASYRLYITPSIVFLMQYASLISSDEFNPAELVVIDWGEGEVIFRERKFPSWTLRYRKSTQKKIDHTFYSTFFMFAISDQ